MPENKDYTIITELPGSSVIPVQLEREYHRYKFGASLCAGKRVLEVGCGGGQGLGILANVAKYVVGGDCSEENLNYARTTYAGRENIRIMNFDAHNLPFEDNSFDVILIYEVIYYLNDIERFLSECKRVLDKNGMLIICTANKDWPDFNASPFSVKYYSVQELGVFLQGHGFKCSFYGAFPERCDTLKARLRSIIKRSAVKFHLIPKSMKGKEPLKRLFFGKLVKLPQELKDGMVNYLPPSEIPADSVDKIHSAIFAIGSLNQDKEAEKISFPLVSVLVTIYNNNTEAEISRSLNSILAQDYPNLEIVIVYDGPVKKEVMETVEKIMAKSRVPIKLKDIKDNIGAGAALNVAIELSGGEYLAVMDADDHSFPDRIREQALYMEKHADIDVLGCLVEEAFEDGTKNVPKMPLTHDECVREFLWRNPINHPTAFFRRRFFEKAGLYQPDAKNDWDSALWLAGMNSGCKFANLKDVKYRMVLDSSFFKRRKKAHIAVLRTRMKIVSKMNFGIKGYFFALLRFMVMIFPMPFLQKAYRSRNFIWAKLTGHE